MKTLSLWQPWATLEVLGMKGPETRSWATKYRGPLAIHATQAHPAVDFHIGEWTMFRHHGVGPLTLGRSGDRNQAEERVLIDLPQGAIVGSGELVDVVPIIDPDDCEWHSEHPRGVGPCAHAAIDGQVIIHRPDAPMHTTVLVVEAYGDYTPGRFAWIIDDVKPTTERCPGCWGKGWHDRHDYGPGSTTQPVGCKLCAGRTAGACGPIFTRGFQHLWEWKP